MAKYAYPAVFTAEETGGYSVNFPDIEACYTCGDTMADALEMAQDILSIRMCDIEDNDEPLPAPSDIRKMQIENNEIVSLVACDTVEYRKLYDDRIVKKTLTLPNWLNTAAEKANINFSAVLREALLAKLNS